MIVIVKLMGGLGNQMFQYAAARSLSSRKIYFDDSFLNKNNISSEDFTARRFELHIFRRLKVKILNPYAQRLLLTKNKKYDFLKLLLPNSLKRICHIDDSNINENLSKKHQNEILYIDGYFQNPTYFNEIRKSLLNEFAFPELDDKFTGLLNDIENSNSVAIHIRRGDYLKSKINEHHGVLPLSYYKNAVKILEGKLIDPKYFIFSDDPNWCKNNFAFLANKEIVSKENEPWIDMYLISKCKNQIIANSSFSWWGAWLNQFINKIVIAPKNWFNSIESNIVPKEWISL
ncbi:alpha-1,2-fucosyltransferase [Pedobacter cryotolerans]|uniref:Alpha-1,2-fucosyltransferase n=1 Tax=Pedobacter cryotolerans TaxID=2571270 RepID=A0A4U1C234_9SPHI|nr:alpha-1,2-fucosyltransferase [Pedobacter cryotolerans]TKB98237.1 alpha-1,2-fucosyltransferase [Pedobacter cryotolerans]